MSKLRCINLPEALPSGREAIMPAPGEEEPVGGAPRREGPDYYGKEETSMRTPYKLLSPQEALPDIPVDEILQDVRSAKRGRMLESREISRIGKKYGLSHWDLQTLLPCAGVTHVSIPLLHSEF